MSKNKPTIKDVVDAAEQVILRKDEEILFLKTGLKTALGGKEPIFLKMPDSLKVANFPETQKVSIEKGEKPVEVRVLNFPEGNKSKTPGGIQDVRVVNSEKSTGWIPEIIKHVATTVVSGFAKRLDMGVLMKMDPEDKLLPQAVILVDVKGRPVNINSQPVMIPMPNSPGGNPPPTRIGAGHLSLTTTAQKLSATIIVCRKVIITALATNAGAIYIGDSSVNYLSGSETGAMLTPTGSVTIDIDDLSKVYAIAENNGDIISFTYQR